MEAANIAVKIAEGLRKESPHDMSWLADFATTRYFRWLIRHNREDGIATLNGYEQYLAAMKVSPAPYFDEGIRRAYMLRINEMKKYLAISK